MLHHVPTIHLLAAIVVLAIGTVNETFAQVDGTIVEPLILVEVTQSHMGMPVHLRVYAPDESAGRAACRIAFERIAALNNILSDYEPESELSRFVREAGRGPRAGSEDFIRVLDASLALARRSDGLLDPTAAPVIRLWRKARADGHVPAPDAVAEALDRVGYQYLKVDVRDNTAELLRTGMQLDLGAIAKGYIGDQAIRVLRGKGVPRAMFEAGGDMVFGDPPPGEAGWLVQPQADGLPELRLANCAAAISGNTVQFIEIDSKRYGHIIDPRTGEPIRTDQVCLVTAPTGLDADPLATLGTLMPRDDFDELIQSHYPKANVWITARTPPDQPEHLEHHP